MLSTFKHSLLLTTVLSFYAQAVEPLSDNLQDFDSTVKEFTVVRPALFGEASRTVFVRRDKVNVPGLQSNQVDVRASFVSGTGSSIFRSETSVAASARRALDAAKFENVSGRAASSFDAPKFVSNANSSITTGVDFAAASSLARISQDIYLELPSAAKTFANMGFTEQRYIVALKSDTEAAVLKNKDVIVIVARGTEPTAITDWMTDAKFFQIKLLKGESPRAHLGFAQATADIMPLIKAEVVSTLENKIRAVVAKLAQRPGGAAKLASYGINGKVAAPDLRPIYLTGHSLGGAIVNLIYGELTLNWLDTSSLGYYFVDPTLAKISDANINKLIKETIEEETVLDADVARTFSFNEEDDFRFAESLTHLATIRNDSPFSATPVGSIEGVTVDRRLKALHTFGAPRSMDWIFKYASEKYASVTGSQIVRFENFHIRSGRRAGSLLADLVPRVPLERVLGGNVFPEYTHVGIRASFETDQEETNGDEAFVKCVYTNKQNEQELSLLADIRFSFSYHNMGLYLKRVSGYNHGRRLRADHSCSALKYQNREAI